MKEKKINKRQEEESNNNKIEDRVKERTKLSPKKYREIAVTLQRERELKKKNRK